MAKFTKYSEEVEEEINQLIQFFNYQKGTHFKWGNQLNRDMVAGAIKKADNDLIVLRNHIKQSDSKELLEVFGSFIPTQTQKIEVEQEPSKYMGLLEKAVVELIAKTNSQEIEDKIFENLNNQVRDFIRSEYGMIERKVNTIINDVKVEMQGVQHEMFDTVLKFVANNEPVFLTGPAGSGKNVLCQQVAKALGLDFYFSNAVTQEYKITGFTDAMGVFHESEFYKAFKNGGVFMLDEMDASIPEVLVILNAAIANKYFDFPAPIGYVEANPNFRVIAAGNTFGLGADYEYVGRNQLDMASLDRFAMIKINYSDVIENNIVNGDIELLQFARDFRNASAKAGIKALLSYRALGRIEKMKQLLPLEEVLQTCLIKGMEKDDLNMLIREMKLDNKYRRTLQDIVRRM